MNCMTAKTQSLHKQRGEHGDRRVSITVISSEGSYPNTKTPLRRARLPRSKTNRRADRPAVRWRSLVPKTKMSHPSQTPAGGSAGLADGGSGHADTINSY